MAENEQEIRSLALTPTWSVASVLTIFVAVSLLVERSIHRLSTWLGKTNRKPLFEAVEKMKEELMLLGFISLLLTATSSSISNICIPSKFYNTPFTPCTKAEADEHEDDSSSEERKLYTASVLPHLFRRMLNVNKKTCKEGYEPFVSYEGLEQLHRFIFIMAVTHISYSCLTMLLAIVKIHRWRVWENEAHMDRHDSLNDITREMTLRRQSTFVRYHTSNPMTRNSFLIWVTCFFRQFGNSVVRADYLTLRKGFIMNHHLSLTYDFHSYMIRSMEEEFQRIVGVSGPLWGFVVAFMLFNVKGSNLYFWIASIPIVLVLLVGTKLQHVIATLALESAGITGSFSGSKLKPRDDLFWFKKPELLLSLIHFILFQNAFELASFFWFWWQFGYNSCFIRNHMLVYARLILGFAGQFLCSYSTLPLYALVTQMGTNYKAALIPQRIRETIHGWGKAARRKRRLRMFADDTTIHTETSTVMSLEDDDRRLIDDTSETTVDYTSIELQPTSVHDGPESVPNERPSRARTPLLQPSTSLSTSVDHKFEVENFMRSFSMPVKR
ncbi:MLO-like protein 11 [Cucumis melo]|uniref:MLO-like protein n=1 Tax=Cucumis melo TaxID=3656 RepID=A0A1S3C8N3_CUCME|nr:MLO-like protein 11 [Cucumis melo]XP_008458728.1 MLO-like protein 11 [Cucumis melo]XP_008458731.1 MLO-like protein 11 [Cucumis melo]XP_008458733.1 MLO-like protein 11 [Cucumis melo]XP_050945565.1 MLO-like protein 11 [Cucumis melo]XP_050945566.1 MLO-like protein 11 [Cucumis melo]XP_050945567.1 MLO-like protein 11 [Cucumis melo]